MISVLKWIGERCLAALRWLMTLCKTILDAIVGLFSSVVTWILAGLAWLINFVVDYVGDIVDDALGNLLQVNLPTLQVFPFAQWIARDIIALDVAWDCFVAYFSVWVATRLVRGSGTAVRFILDIL